MTQFRKKPVVIEAVQWTGNNVSEMEAFAPGAKTEGRRKALIIDTLEGVMIGEPGDWIIRGIKGEFYPCKPDIFAATYEPVVSSTPSPQDGK